MGGERRVLAPWLARVPRLAELAGARTRVVVACSGGADSLALLALVAAAGVDAEAVHVDHRLRPGSEREFSVVASAARDLGLAARSVAADVGMGPNLEARARAARYTALEVARVDAGGALVLVGHTEDDQAETVLLNLLRGAATAGLAAMAPRRGALERPLLGLRRADTVEICARLGLAPVVDPMNAEPRFRRVWLRREVLPTLEAGADRDLRALLARQAEVLRDESDVLDSLAAATLAAAGEPPRVDALRAAEPALARRALRRWLGAPPASLATVDAVLAVVRGERRAVEVPGGRRVVRRRGRLQFEVEIDDAAALEPAPVRIAVPGASDGLGLALESWIERGAPATWPDGVDTCVVDADVVGDQAWLRLPVRGERFAPLGMRGTTSITRVAPERPRVVATDPAGEVVWVVGYRIDDRARITSRTRRFLWMTVSPRVVSLGPA